jgi:hypothetical protein
MAWRKSPSRDYNKTFQLRGRFGQLKQCRIFVAAIDGRRAGLLFGGITRQAVHCR